MQVSGSRRINCREITDLGGMLRCLRERRFWTQAELAERASLPPNTIGEIERNRRDPHMSTLSMLLDALDIDDAVDPRPGAISNNPRQFWDLAHAKDLLGWEPRDRAPV